MKIIKTLILLSSLLFVFTACDILHKENEFDGIDIKPFTSITKLNKDENSVYFGFKIANSRDDSYDVSVTFTPKDEKLKKLIGTQTVEQKNGVNSSSTFKLPSNDEISIGKTIVIPNKEFSSEELEKVINDFTFSINNGKTKKTYE
ncbi:hypothetical protein [Bacillus toyonensis]|uniref:hypothetical protein n=1 Tax=Bacillus toyonensis TaxID=155322 RepID=UPI002E1EDDA7|nr:hypothetical protein [Bacillus toyonensis]